MVRLVVPARQGRGVRLKIGEQIRVVDLEGQQVGDLFAYCAEDISEYLSAEHTRVNVGRLFPLIGEAFSTNRRRPILTLESDTSAGTHDMLVAACDPTRYAQLGVESWHPSCQENLQRVMAEFGYPNIEVPQPVNLFQNSPFHTNGVLQFLPAASKPGDAVTFKAEMDCLLVLTSCSQDLLPVNGNGPTALALETAN